MSEIQRPHDRLPAGRNAVTTRTSLSLPAAMSIDAWRDIGERISRISDASTWWLGDWIVYGQAKYPDRYKRAIDETGLDYQTLRNYAWIARKFGAPRRRGKLSIQHHIEVAFLPEAEQDVWLDRAERFKWSKGTLRRYLKAAKLGLAENTSGADPSENVPGAEEVVLSLKVSPDRRKSWQEAAVRSARDLNEWIMIALDTAAASYLAEISSAVPGME
jgi:hypothetical protein